MDSKEVVDKRKHKRFRSQDLAFVTKGNISDSVRKILHLLHSDLIVRKLVKF
jgi:hypothetical protein